MNLISLIKVSFTSAILLVLVLLGVNNRAMVDFNLSPLMGQVVRQPAALMYITFFAAGLITGAILSLGGGKKAGKKSGKPA